MSRSGIACYRNGGCGPYEMYSCSECPASKADYVQFKTKPKPMTNYDRIISKTPEELAEWITTVGRTFGEEYEGYMSALDWLKAPVEEADE